MQRNCSSTVFLLPFDIGKTEFTAGIVAKVLQQVGKIDFLVNCAGISQRSYAKLTGQQVYHQLMQVNYFGTVALTLEVLKHFLSRNAGEFIAISSVAGIVGLPKRTAYCASKLAIEGFFASLRTELWKTNIHILMVRPGAVKTNIARNALTANGSALNTSDKTIEQGMLPERMCPGHY